MNETEGLPDGLQLRVDAERMFREFGHRLHQIVRLEQEPERQLETVEQARHVKSALEALLTRLFSRTERALIVAAEHGPSDHEEPTTPLDASLGPGDISAYRHLVDSFQAGGQVGCGAVLALRAAGGTGVGPALPSLEAGIALRRSGCCADYSGFALQAAGRSRLGPSEVSRTQAAGTRTQSWHTLGATVAAMVAAPGPLGRCLSVQPQAAVVRAISRHAAKRGGAGQPGSRGAGGQSGRRCVRHARASAISRPDSPDAGLRALPPLAVPDGEGRPLVVAGLEPGGHPAIGSQAAHGRD